jgi:hypothetical protein
MDNSATSRPAAPEAELAVWSWMGRHRTPLLTAGVSGVLAFTALSAALVATAPTYLAKVVQVWTERQLTAGGQEQIYKLNFSPPDEMYIEDDLELKMSIADVTRTYGGDPEHIRVHIELDAPSFKVAPANGITLPLKDGRSDTFIVMASATGNRQIRVVDQLWFVDPLSPEKLWPTKLLPTDTPENIINIKVRERPVFMILNRRIMTDIQVGTAIVGFPSLLVFFLTGWRERRKEKKRKEREDMARRVVGPQGPYRKPSKIDH